MIFELTEMILDALVDMSQVFCPSWNTSTGLDALSRSN